MRHLVLITALSLLSSSALAQTTAPDTPIEIPTPGGKVVSPDRQRHQSYYGEWHFAPARVEGNLVYLSGVVAGARDGVPLDVAGYETALRRTWTALRKILEAAGASTDSIVDLTTFHVFGSSSFTGTKAEHIAAFRRVKDEFVPEPYPTWTGIGVAALFPDTGLVEIKIIARLKSAPSNGK